MSVEKAKTLLRSLRWHHLGFAFVWVITFAGLSAPDGFAGQRLFSLSDQLCALAAVGAAVLYERRRMPFPPRSAPMVGVLLAAGSAAYYLAANGGVPVLPGSLAAGVLVGLALGSSYVLWQQFFASEGASRTAVFIPLSALLSVVLSVLLALLPDVARALCSVAVLPVAAAVSLGRCLREIVPADPRPRMTGAAAAATVRMLWKPVFCTCAIGFVWKLVSHLFAVPGGIASPPVLAGMALAVAVVVLIELLSETGFAVLRVYQILFPLVTGAFLLPTLLGVQFAPFASGMLLFGFEIVNLLLIVTSAVYASERSLPSTQVYALCVGPTLAAMLAGDVVGTGLSPLAAYDFALAVNVLFVCVYALSLVLFCVAFTRKGHRGRVAAEAEHDMAVVGAAAFLSPGVLPAGAAGRSSATGSDAVAGSAAGAIGTPVPAAAGEPGPQAGSAGAPSGPGAETCPERLPGEGAAAAPGADGIATLIERRMDALDLAEPFSPREREVVALVLRGNNVPAIARKLYISENTTRDHMKSIYRKADVHSRQELIDLFD
ncbi:helix-turn-helix transcriptional regulator [Gordonibacter urolithinfaciens]|uniref:helix-turn-helix transcriptional regulator n=1 Tax=Gordonibacter urolithinfaciens TaxID=1335613 RepID=UPI003A93F4B3